MSNQRATSIEAKFYIGSLDPKLVKALCDLFTDVLYHMVQEAAPDAAVALEYNELKETENAEETSHAEKRRPTDPARRTTRSQRP